MPHGCNVNLWTWVPKFTTIPLQLHLFHQFPTFIIFVLSLLSCISYVAAVAKLPFGALDAWTFNKYLRNLLGKCVIGSSSPQVSFWGAFYRLQRLRSGFSPLSHELSMIWEVKQVEDTWGSARPMATARWGSAMPQCRPWEFRTWFLTCSSHLNMVSWGSLLGKWF